MKKVLSVAIGAIMMASVTPVQAATMESYCNDYGYWKERKDRNDDAIKDIVLLAKRNKVKEKGGFEGSNKRICRDEMDKGADRAKREKRQYDRKNKD